MSPKDTILLTLDALRADYCGYVIEDGKDLTPQLDSLAEQGIAYRNAIAPGPRTPSSVPTLFTGSFHQYRDGRPERTWEYRHRRLREFIRRQGTLAEKMSDQSIETAAVVLNPWVTSETGFDIGFDKFKDLDSLGSRLFKDRGTLSLFDKILEGTGISKYTPWSSQKYWFVHWKGVYHQIMEVVEQLDSPYFLWVFLLDCHLPYISPREFRSNQSRIETLLHLYSYGRWTLTDYELSEGDIKRLQEAYHDVVRATDGFIGKLVSDVEERGDKPAIFIHADHGEGLGDHGTFSHQKQLYEENIRVPLVVYNAGQQADIEKQISLKSLPQIIQSVSNTSITFDPYSFTEDWVLSQTELGDKISLRGHGYKYIQTAEGHELYDLQTDVDEQQDISGDYETLSKNLNKLAMKWIDHQQEQRTHYDAARMLAESHNL